MGWSVTDESWILVDCKGSLLGSIHVNSQLGQARLDRLIHEVLVVASSLVEAWASVDSLGLLVTLEQRRLRLAAPDTTHPVRRLYLCKVSLLLVET